MISLKLKRHLNEKNTLSDHNGIHRHRNLNETERSAIARYRNFNVPKICKITVSRKRGRERWHKWLQESACTPLQDRMLEVQQHQGVPSRKHKTGTTVLVLTSHLPSATSKSTNLTDQASFPSTDTVITTKKKLVLTLNEIVNACLRIF